MAHSRAVVSVKDEAAPLNSLPCSSRINLPYFLKIIKKSIKSGLAPTGESAFSVSLKDITRNNVTPN